VTDVKPNSRATRPYPGLTFGCGATVAVIGLERVADRMVGLASEVLFSVSNGAITMDLSAHPAMFGLVDFITVSAVLIVGSSIAKASLRDVYPLQRFSPWLIPMLAPVALGISILGSETVNLLDLVLPTPTSSAILFEDVQDISHKFVSLILLVVLVGPVLEELLFRGLVLHALLRRYSTGVAIVVSSALFAAAHLNPWQIPITFGTGLILGWIFIKTRSLWPCIIVHALVNGAPLLVLVTVGGIPGYTGELAEGSFHQPLLFDLLGLVALFNGLSLTAFVLMLGRSPRKA